MGATIGQFLNLTMDNQHPRLEPKAQLRTYP